jgi:hypothetical protein
VIAPGNVQHAVEAGMHQYEVTAAIKYRYGD